MQCNFCNSYIQNIKPGFTVCPNCGHVNIPSASQMPTTLYSGTPAPKPKFWHSKKLLELPAIAALVFIGLLILGIYSNSHANKMLSAAIMYDQQGKYVLAEQQIPTTHSLFTLPSLRKKIAGESAKNSKWITYFGYQVRAEELIKIKKYSDAVLLLNKISKDYPTYKFVVADLASASHQFPSSKQTAAVAPTTTPASQKSSPPTQNIAQAPQSPGCFAPTSISGKRYVATSAFSSILAAQSVDAVQQQLQSFLSQYGVSIEISSVSPSSYAKTYDSYTLLGASDLCYLRAYAAIFVDEWAKYPVDWVQSSGVKDIIIVKDLAVQGQHRAAMPDPGGYDMYYDATFSGDYAREVLHHEYDHLITYKYFGNFSPSDSTWTSYNPPGFAYGSGGSSCYTPGNCLTGEHPTAGFATGYATSAIEEDKAETYAYLMTNTYYHHLSSWLAGDPYLSNKVAYYKQFIASHSPEMSGNYYNLINP